MGVNLHKDVTMTLQQTNQNHGFAENNSSVTNAPRPLARGRDCEFLHFDCGNVPPSPPRDSSNSFTQGHKDHYPTQP